MLKETGRFVCWICRETEGYQGNPEFALADLLAIPIKQVKAKLYGEGGVTPTWIDLQVKDLYNDPELIETSTVSLKNIVFPYDYYPIDHEFAVKGLAYLKSRGISLEIAQKYNLRYSPIEERVIFPVESKGNLYGWQGRLIVPDKYVDSQGISRKRLKIKSSLGIPRDRTLMFSDQVTGNHAILTEGPVDAIKADLCSGNVACMGKAVTRAQVAILLNAGVKKLYLALDPDAADEIGRLVKTYFDDVELFEMLANNKGPNKADLGAMDYEEVLDLFNSARKINPGRIFVYFKRRIANKA